MSSSRKDNHLVSSEPTSIHALIRQGLTAQALVALQNGVNPNATDKENQTLICTAISCGNEDVLKQLLQLGPDISVTPRQDGNPVWGRSLIPISITLLFVALQFRLPDDLLEAFKFTILSIPVETFIWSILTSADILYDKSVIWCIMIIYLPLTLISHFFTARLQAFAFALLHSQSLSAYIFRRLLLYAAQLVITPTRPQLPRAPGVEAVIATVGYKGEAQGMMKLLLESGLDIGSPRQKGSLFQIIWTWAIRRGHAEIVAILSSRPDIPSHLFVSFDELEPLNVLSYIAHKGYSNLLRVLLNAHDYEPTTKATALLACLSHTMMNTSRCVATITALLQHGIGIDISIACHEGRSALSWACHFEDCHIHLVPLLLQHGAGATVNINDSDGKAALHHAVWWNGENSTSTIDLLLDAGADINILDTSGHTPLWEAASKSVPSVIAHLLKRGAKVDFRSPESTTPLMEACLHNGIVAAAILLADGADPNAGAPDDTPLASAVRQQYHQAVNDDLVYMLLQAGACPIVPLSDQFQLMRQPLVQCIHSTCQDGEWLLELLEAARTSGPIPLEILNCAIQQMFQYVPYMHLDGLLALLHAGGDPSTQSSQTLAAEGGTVMHFTVRNYPHHRGDVRKILRFLVNSPFLLCLPADLLFVRDDLGDTPLHVAAYSSNKTAIKELISIAESLNLLQNYVDTIDSSGYTPLAIACQCPPTSATGYTRLNAHPDLDGPEFFGGRLHDGRRAAIITQRFEQAVYSVDTEDNVELLLEAGSNPLTMSNDDLTPLHLACRAGNPVVAGVLLQNRKRCPSSAQLRPSYTMRSLLTLNDSQGRTPLHFAAQSGNVELVRMVLATNVLRVFNGREVTPDEDILWPSHAASETEILHAKDDSGYRPLHYAMEAGHVGVIRVFLDEVEEFEWDLYRYPDDGVSDIRLAEAGGHDEIISLLQASNSTKLPASQEFKRDPQKCNLNELRENKVDVEVQPSGDKAGDYDNQSLQLRWQKFMKSHHLVQVRC
ncbi:hypothetical protein NLJ89_g1544 [Agrocybe chaxingu]|uniref:Ankyrin n=1 Tax=Agrocybe chaxingu TaxID=84603 RepID=A0A9W8MZV4_9AGAR|nr:hypothetical protein NLJ89_g1544 [Agrocybe chaxingu]